MNVSTPFKTSDASQTMSLEAIFLHTQEQEGEKKDKNICVDQGYWGGCMALEELAGHRMTSSLYRAAQLIQSHHGLSYGA